MGFSISGPACRCRATARRKPGSSWKSCSKRIPACRPMPIMAPWNPAVTPDLLMLEDEGDRLVLRPIHADHHAAIRGQGVTFEGNRAGLRGCHLQHVVIPPGLALEVFAGVNRGAAVGVGHIAIEEGLGGACIHETARDGDDAPVSYTHLR